MSLALVPLVLVSTLAWPRSSGSEVEAPELVIAAVGVADANHPHPTVPSLRSGIPLVVEVIGGQRYEGAFVGLRANHLRVSTHDGLLEVPVPVITAVSVQGVSYEPEAFLEGVQRWGQELAEQAVRVPPPALVACSSVLWAGAGPALLGDWQAFAAYSLLEASFLGAGAVMIVNEQYGPLLPLAALEVLLHGWAAGDSVRESRRRRSRAELAVMPTLHPASGSAPVVGLGLALHVGAPASAVYTGVLPWSDACSVPGLTGPCSFP